MSIFLDSDFKTSAPYFSLLSMTQAIKLKYIFKSFSSSFSEIIKIKLEMGIECIKKFFYI